MKKTEFLELFNEIDDDFVKELSELPEKPRRVSFFRPLMSAAAVVCVIAVGVFVYARSNKPQSVSPNDSGLSQSGVCISNESASDSISIPIPEKNESDPSGCHLTQFATAFSADNKSFCSGPVVKVYGGNYAQIALEYSGATEREPLCISLYEIDSVERRVASEEIKITDGRADKMMINYTKSVSPGAEIMLVITTTNENAYAKGTWIP